jgi:hypothetical protein
VGCLPGAVMKDLHRFLRPADVNFLPDERPGHAVKVLVELDVIVDVDARLFPVRELVGLSRQRGQLRFVQALEEFSPRLPQMAHRAAVQFLQQLADGPVQFCQTEEGMVAQPGQNPAFHHLYA